MNWKQLFIPLSHFLVWFCFLGAFNPQFADKFPFVKIDKRKLHGAKKKAAQEFSFNSKFSTLLRLHIMVLLHKS